MPETGVPKQPASGQGNPAYSFKNLPASFARELVGDLSGLGEAFDKGDVTSWDFLQFCVAHLRKIDTFIDTIKT